ncbi:MAG: hypothetical protein G01um101470_6 [Parcubacteria group bacterium Gr01-1014_70]|nr:MAG: hypothetical protein G01um101470_6 [Parcubacteria group bacterium Gr01-1014_70]
MYKAAIILIILFALMVSFQDFLVQPAYWFDEAITIEIARNFNMFGKLDILTAPGVFSGVPYIAGTNGYPLTVPLASWFRVVGYGLAQARLFMMLWLVACLLAIYAITKKLYGVVPALGALLLVSTFASFYGNGLTATGEVPGFLFFLLSLYVLTYKKQYTLGGICAGLAMAAKPGVYLFLAHAIFVFILFTEQGARIKSLVRFCFGLMPPILLWILLVFPLSRDTFFSTIVYVLNPLDIPILRDLLGTPAASNLNTDLIIASSESALTQARENALLLLTGSTGIYFLLIAFVVLLMFLFVKNQTPEQKRFLQLSLLYGVFALAYFLRGPGWIRYLLGFQVLFLLLLTPALEALGACVKEKFVPLFRYDTLFLFLGVAALVGAQVYHLFYLANIPRSNAARNAVLYVDARMEENPTLTVGLVNVPEVAAFSDPLRTYHMVWLQRTMAPFGRHIFETENRPSLVLTDGKDFLLGEGGERILQNEYVQTNRFGRYRMYEFTFLPAKE